MIHGPLRAALFGSGGLQTHSRGLGLWQIELKQLTFANGFNCSSEEQQSYRCKSKIVQLQQCESVNARIQLRERKAGRCKCECARAKIRECDSKMARIEFKQYIICDRK